MIPNKPIIYGLKSLKFISSIWSLMYLSKVIILWFMPRFYSVIIYRAREILLNNYWNSERVRVLSGTFYASWSCYLRYDIFFFVSFFIDCLTLIGTELIVLYLIYFPRSHIFSKITCNYSCVDINSSLSLISLIYLLESCPSKQSLFSLLCSSFLSVFNSFLFMSCLSRWVC